MLRFSRIVVVTKRTQLQELLDRFVTEAQARFYLEHMGLSLSDYEEAHARYTAALETLVDALPSTPRHFILDRVHLPTFDFREGDLVVTLGGNGLVVNAAKYADGRPIFAVNPDPGRHDAILVPFRVSDVKSRIPEVLRGRFETRQVTMAEAKLNDGQRLVAFNDLFVGRRDHASARYHLEVGGHSEEQSSSGIIVSTGAGSTGWLKSVVTGSLEVVRELCPEVNDLPATVNCRSAWSAEWLRFAVREPFASSRTQTGIVFGMIGKGERMRIVSRMPEGGVIFSDGILEDALPFTSGSVAEIVVSDRRANLIAA